MNPRSIGVLLALAFVPAIARADDDSPQGVGGTRLDQPQPRVVKPPKLVKFVEAAYPEAEKATGKQAAVTLQIGITESGTVAIVTVLESAGPAFDAAAIAAAQQFVFEPATVNGRPTAVKIAYRYEFVIHEELKKKTTADFAGQVVDRATHKPLANVTVALDTGQTATTDAEGKFSIADVPPGTHTVTLSGDQLTAIGTQEEFEAS